MFHWFVDRKRFVPKRTFLAWDLAVPRRFILNQLGRITQQGRYFSQRTCRAFLAGGAKSSQAEPRYPLAPDDCMAPCPVSLTAEWFSLPDMGMGSENREARPWIYSRTGLQIAGRPTGKLVWCAGRSTAERTEESGKGFPDAVKHVSAAYVFLPTSLLSHKRVLSIPSRAIPLRQPYDDNDDADSGTPCA